MLQIRCVVDSSFSTTSPPSAILVYYFYHFQVVLPDIMLYEDNPMFFIEDGPGVIIPVHGGGGR